MKDKILNLLGEKHSLKLEEINESLGIDAREQLQELINENLIYFNRDFYYDLKSNGLGIGKFTIDRDGNCFLDGQIFDCNRKIIDNLALMNDDVVLYRYHKGRIIVEKVIKRNVFELVGTITKGKRTFFNVIYPKMKQQFLVKDDKTYQEKVLYKAKIKDYQKKLVIIEEEIGNATSLTTQIDGLLSVKDVKKEFSQEIETYVENLDDEITNLKYPDYKDLTEELLFTIDGDDAKDFDDAIGIVKNEDGYILTVAIADVSAYVKENSLLDKRH